MISFFVSFVKLNHEPCEPVVKLIGTSFSKLKTVVSSELVRPSPKLFRLSFYETERGSFINGVPYSRFPPCLLHEICCFSSLYGAFMEPPSEKKDRLRCLRGWIALLEGNTEWCFISWWWVVGSGLVFFFKMKSLTLHFALSRISYHVISWRE